MPEGKPEPVIAEAVVRTRNPLKSIAELGPMVRDARKAMKMNQAELAAHAGVGRRFVSELEGGEPSLEFNKALAVRLEPLIRLERRRRIVGSHIPARLVHIVQNITASPRLSPAAGPNLPAPSVDRLEPDQQSRPVRRAVHD